MKNKISIVVLVFIISLSGVFLFSLKNKDPEKNNVAGGKEVIKDNKDSEVKKPLILSREQVQKALEDTDMFVKTAVDTLRKKFGDTISDVRVQLKLINLRDFIKKHYPDKWKELFEEIVMKAFPSYGNSILSIIERMDEYNKWLASSENFRGMSFDQIKKSLDDIRSGFFGKDASLIWNEDEKVEYVRDILAIIDKSSNTLDEKLGIFTSKLEDKFRDDKKTFMDRKYNLSVAFFSLNSVQNELGTLGREERERKLAGIRKKIGYSDREILLLSKRDKERDDRWENGLNYMEERKNLEKSYTGSELEGKIDDLRSRYFGFEAKTIALEEKEGFFRYRRNRVFGRN